MCFSRLSRSSPSNRFLISSQEEQCHHFSFWPKIPDLSSAIIATESAASIVADAVTYWTHDTSECAGRLRRRLIARTRSFTTASRLSARRRQLPPPPPSGLVEGGDVDGEGGSGAATTSSGVGNSVLASSCLSGPESWDGTAGSTGWAQRHSAVLETPTNSGALRLLMAAGMPPQTEAAAACNGDGGLNLLSGSGGHRSGSIAAKGGSSKASAGSKGQEALDKTVECKSADSLNVSALKTDVADLKASCSDLSELSDSDLEVILRPSGKDSTANTSKGSVRVGGTRRSVTGEGATVDGGIEGDGCTGGTMAYDAELVVPGAVLKGRLLVIVCVLRACTHMR